MKHTLAIVFPGQGSQVVGMLSDIAPHFHEVNDTFSQASDILQYDLWSLVAHGPAEKLNETVYTQPALLTASIAIWRILKTHTLIKPSYLAGHSLGEYSALVCANALAFADAVKLVAERGRLMQAAVRPGEGGMAAIIGLDNHTIELLCATVATESQSVVMPANYNSLGQVVVAGYMPAVDRVIRLAKERGAKMAVHLPVSVPSHCSLMIDAAGALKQALATVTFHPPEIPVISNIDAKPYQSVADIQKSLTKQLYLPVRWVETIQYMVQQHVQTVIECGPGKILTGLNRRIANDLTYLTTTPLNHLEALIKIDNTRSAES